MDIRHIGVVLSVAQTAQTHSYRRIEDKDTANVYLSCVQYPLLPPLNWFLPVPGFE